MIPRSGAVVRYPHLTHGGFLGFIMSWAFLLATITVPAIEAEAVVTYASGNPYFDISGLTTTSQGVTILTGLGILVAVVLMVCGHGVDLHRRIFEGRLRDGDAWRSAPPLPVDKR